MNRTVHTTLTALLALTATAGAAQLQLGLRGLAVNPIPLGPKDTIESFYSYGDPNHSSANTGYEQSNVMTILPVVQADGVNGLVFIFDEPGDGSNGEIDFTLSGLKGASLIVEDDGEFSHGDRYAYNPYTEQGRIHCRWFPCCTDGAAFRFEEELPGDLFLDTALSYNLDHARIVGLDPESGESLILDDLPLSLALTVAFIDTPEEDGEEDGETPLDAAVLQPATPNPFNPATTLRWQLPEAGYSRLEVFDILGRRVALLHEGRLEAGEHSTVFEAGGLASGNYFLCHSGPAGRETQILTLLK